jgi:isopentenyl-diphosphate delta-isomerase
VASAALPFVGPSLKGKEAVVSVLSCMLEEFKAAMFLCGCANIQALHNAPVVVTGWTREYLEQRGFNVKDLSFPKNAV